MKKILFALTFLLTITSYNSIASHFAGGELTYEYIGPGPGGTGYEYDLTLVVYGDVSGIPFGNTANITYTSSCDGGGSINAIDPDGAVLVTSNDVCAPNTVFYRRYEYSATVILPVNCNDWIFYWTGCCRNGAITNGFANDDWYVHAELNNNFGQNSSPIFDPNEEPVKAFCVKAPTDKPFFWQHRAIEADGDSLIYTLTNPLGGFGATPTVLPYGGGYSVINPFNTHTNQIYLDNSNGTVTFLPSNPDVAVFKIDVEEYRFDTVGLLWVQIGRITRDIQIEIAQVCQTNIAEGPRIDVSSSSVTSSSISKDSLKDFLAPYGIDTIYMGDTTTAGLVNVYTITNFNCFDKNITIPFNKDILKRSLNPDGNEFRLIGPDGIPRPITGVSFTGAPDEIFDSIIIINLHKGLDENGLYVLYTKKGRDGDTYVGECGVDSPNFDIKLIDVKNCPDLEYSLDNVTVVDDKDRRINWSIVDPNYLQPSLFNYWNIGMKVGGASYSIKVNDINARSYLDQVEFFPNHVDHQNFEYSIQLVQNADFKRPGKNQLVTILLKDSLSVVNLQNDIIHFSWNPYNAWDQNVTTYQMEKAEFQMDSTTIKVAWSDYKTGGVGYGSETFNVDKSSTNNEGLFAFRVKAEEQGNPPPVGYESESNWLYVLVEYVEEPDVSLPTLKAPNVFTPNGDFENDRFYINAVNGGRDYTNVQLSVFNRWGQLVYEDLNFGQRNTSEKGWDGTSIYTGEKLADGVYYYIAKFNDPLTGTSEELQGSVTILGSSGSK